MEASEAQQIVSPETTPAEPAAPAAEQPAAQEPAGGEQAQAPDLSEQVTALQQEIAALRGEVAPEPAESSDLYTQLSGAPEGEPAGYAPEGEYLEPGYDYGQEQDDPFEEAIRERVAEAMSPILESIETDRRRGQLEEVAEKHPELRDEATQQAIAARLAPLAERYGNELILTDPELVEATLVSIKAAQATASEVPAEQAVAQGARLETAAGAANPQAESTPEEQIKQGVLGHRGGGDAFT